MHRSRVSLIIVALILLILVGFPEVRVWLSSQMKQQKNSNTRSKKSVESSEIGSKKPALESSETVPGKFAFVTESNNVVIKSVGDDSTSTIYELTNDEYAGLSFSPDGKKLLLNISGEHKTDAEDRIIIYDIRRKKIRTLLEFSGFGWFSDDQLYKGFPEYSSYYDLEKNRYFKIDLGLRGVGEVSGESQDGERIVIANYRGRRVRVGKKGQWRQLVKFQTPGPQVGATWIGEDRIGVIKYQPSAPLLIFDKKTGKLVRRLAVPSNPDRNPNIVSFFRSSPDGSNLLFFDSDGTGKKTIFWLMNSENGKHRKLLEGSANVLYWLPDSRHLLVLTEGNELWLADSEADQILKEKLANGFKAVAWTPY